MATKQTRERVKTIIDRLVDATHEPLARNQSLSPLWARLDHNARYYVVMCIAFYTKFLPEPSDLAGRKEHFAPILLRVDRQIRGLKKASKERRIFQELVDPKLGKVADWGSLSWPETVEFSIVLDREVERLNNLVRKLRILRNESRLGLAGMLHHLYMAQEFVEKWGKLEGKSLKLRPVELAEVIAIVESERGWHKPDLNRADNLYKALGTFRSNRRNRAFLKLLSERVSREVELCMELDSGNQKT